MTREQFLTVVCGGENLAMFSDGPGSRDGWVKAVDLADHLSSLGHAVQVPAYDGSGHMIAEYWGLAGSGAAALGRSAA